MFRRTFLVLFVVINISILAMADSVPKPAVPVTDKDIFLPTAVKSKLAYQTYFFAPMLYIHLGKEALFAAYYLQTYENVCRIFVTAAVFRTFPVTENPYSASHLSYNRVVLNMQHQFLGFGYEACHWFFERRDSYVMSARAAWYEYMELMKRKHIYPMVKGDDVCFKNPYILCQYKPYMDFRLWGLVYYYHLILHKKYKPNKYDFFPMVDDEGRYIIPSANPKGGSPEIYGKMHDGDMVKYKDHRGHKIYYMKSGEGTITVIVNDNKTKEAK